MKKEVENAVSLDTGKLCPSCKEYNILEKIIRKIIRWVSNGSIGPSSSAYAETEIIVTYFCGGCGQTFLPTKINKLDEHLADHKNFILPLLEGNTPMILTRSLGCGEVFKNIVYEDTDPEFVRIEKNDQHFFEQGSLIHIKSNNLGFQESFEYYNSWERDFDLNPYIVPTDAKNVFYITWWAKKVYKQEPLLKGEKREKLSLLKRQLADVNKKLKLNKTGSIKVISHGDEFTADSLQQQIDKVDTETKRVEVISEPLPEGSVMAKLVKIVDSKNFSIRKFYIPENAIG